MDRTVFCDRRVGQACVACWPSAQMHSYRSLVATIVMLWCFRTASWQVREAADSQLILEALPCSYHNKVVHMRILSSPSSEIGTSDQCDIPYMEWQISSPKGWVMSAASHVTVWVLEKSLWLCIHKWVRWEHINTEGRGLIAFTCRNLP